MDDHELLRQYARSHSEEAFRELVDRHLPMVYSTALRVVNDGQLAQEIAQEAFTALAQKAAELKKSQILGGWLYHTARHLAQHARRTEHRRRTREQRAVAMKSFDDQSEPEQLLHNLEPAMAELEETDRDALLLRYLEDRSFRDVGQQLGISEDAARMRVNRALERLRGAFEHQGITVSSALLAAALGASTTSAVPAGMASTIAATAVAANAATAMTGATAAASWLNIKTVSGILGAVFLSGTATYLLKEKQIALLRGENGALLARQRELAAEVGRITQQIQARQQDVERLRSEHLEVLRLRNEVGELRRQQRARNQHGDNAVAKEVIWSLNPKVLAENPPVALIRPSSGNTTGMISSQHGTIALGTYLSNIFGYAYEFGANRVIMPPDAPQGQFDFLDTFTEGGREAMRRLLKDQFGLVAKREVRMVASLRLTLENANAPALKMSTRPLGTEAVSGPGAGQSIGQASARPDRIAGKGMLLSELGARLEAKLGFPVNDQTGLTDRFDFDLSFNSGASPEEIKRALLDQAGLALSQESQKQPVEFLLVEKVQ